MAHNVYTSQSISGYNASPPPDDGSQTTDNKLEWAKHKVKLTDPVKVLAEAIDSAVHDGFDNLVMTDDPASETVVIAMRIFN